MSTLNKHRYTCMFTLPTSWPWTQSRAGPRWRRRRFLSEHVDATGQKTGLEERVEIRLRHSLLLCAHRAPRKGRATRIPKTRSTRSLSGRLVCRDVISPPIIGSVSHCWRTYADASDRNTCLYFEVTPPLVVITLRRP